MAKTSKLAINELRLGSCFILKDEVCYVSKIQSESIGVLLFEDNIKQYKEVAVDELQPIEVTPEIVLKCGWLRHERFPHRDVFHSVKGDFIINVMSGVSELSFGMNGNFSLIAHRTLYLHQFQNIYFSLTNEELVIAL